MWCHPMSSLTQIGAVEAAAEGEVAAAQAAVPAQQGQMAGHSPAAAGAAAVGEAMAVPQQN